MTRGPWTYSGSFPRSDDLSQLEESLHTGRVNAAELGYTHEPDTIETEDVMRVDGGVLTEDEALAAGVEFRPDLTRYRMTWSA